MRVNTRKVLSREKAIKILKKRYWVDVYRLPLQRDLIGTYCLMKNPKLYFWEDTGGGRFFPLADINKDKPGDVVINICETRDLKEIQDYMRKRFGDETQEVEG